jgi:hypothetical protein
MRVRPSGCVVPHSQMPDDVTNSHSRRQWWQTNVDQDGSNEDHMNNELYNHGNIKHDLNLIHVVPGDLRSFFVDDKYMV